MTNKQKYELAFQRAVKMRLNGEKGERWRKQYAQAMMFNHMVEIEEREHITIKTHLPWKV